MFDIFWYDMAKEGFEAWRWKSKDASSKRHLTKLDRLQVPGCAMEEPHHFRCCVQDILCVMAVGSLSLAGGLMMQLSCKMLAYPKPESVHWLHRGYRNIQDHTGMWTQISKPYAIFSNIYIYIYVLLLVYTYIFINYHHTLQYNHVDFGFVFMPCLDIILPKEPAGPRQDDTQKARLGLAGGFPIYGDLGILWRCYVHGKILCFWMTCPLVN